jgi:hypothetical protein
LPVSLRWIPPSCSVSRRPIWAGARGDNLLVGPGTPEGRNADKYRHSKPYSLHVNYTARHHNTSPMHITNGNGLQLRVAQTRRQVLTSTPAPTRHDLHHNLHCPPAQLLLWHGQVDGHKVDVSIITKLHFHRVQQTPRRLPRIVGIEQAAPTTHEPLAPWSYRWSRHTS